MDGGRVQRRFANQIKFEGPKVLGPTPMKGSDSSQCSVVTKSRRFKRDGVGMSHMEERGEVKDSVEAGFDVEFVGVAAPPTE